jgi:hypothetical protein
VIRACIFILLSVLEVTQRVPPTCTIKTDFTYRHDPFLVTVGGPSCPGDGAIVKIDLHGLWPQVMGHVVGDGSVHSDGGGGGVGQQGDEGVDLQINPINQGRGQSIQSIQSIKGGVNQSNREKNRVSDDSDSVLVHITYTKRQCSDNIQHSQ